MNENLTPSLPMDSQEVQKMMQQVLLQTFQSLPKPKFPSWLEGIIAYIQSHPLESLFFFVLALLFISAIVREVVCSYLKTNEILSRLKKIEKKLVEDRPNRP